MARTGSCLCGAVSYSVSNPMTQAGACHCGMCRKFSGGVYIGVQVAPDEISFEGADNIATYTSSDWAERAFCKTCGSSLYYRVTAPGPHQGVYHLGMGTVDDPSGLTMTEEIFTDVKPAGYSFAGDLKGMTGDEVFAMFAEGDT